MTTFVDTSAFYAILDRRDANHPPAGQAWRRLLDDDVPLVTHNYVLLETISVLQHRLGPAAVHDLRENLLRPVHVHWIDETRHQAAVEAALAAGRRKLSVVDCVSFQVMRHLGLDTVFCFDEHFREQGFEVIP